MNAVESAGGDGDKRLRVLHVEDSPDDAELLVRCLRQQGFDPIYDRVETGPAMAQALATGAWDVVLSDYELPQFSGPAALNTLQASGLDIPFLLVSGAIGEELAVDIMRRGAHDYIPKGNLARLVPALQRELREAQARRERRWLEDERAALLELAAEIGGTLDLREILEHAQRRIASLMQCESVLTYRWDDARGAFRLLFALGVPDELVEAAPIIEVPRHVVSSWLLGGELRAGTRRSTQSWIPSEWLHRFNWAACLGAPLVVRGELVGALVAARVGQRQGFAPHEIQLFDRMARHVAMATGAAELYRAQREDTQVTTALARVGRELIASLATSGLLSRLCELSADVLPCDRSSTWFRDPERDCYVAVAGCGYTAEQWEALRVAGIPGANLDVVIARLAQESVLDVSAHASVASLLGLVDQQEKSVVLIGLRRGEAIVGMQAAIRLGRAQPFDAVALRIASGLAQLASLALETARLVEELDRSNRLKSDFLATMSHELRTPLHIIMGYNSLLLDGEFGPLTPTQVRPLEVMQRSAEGLHELIAVTLDISRVERGQVSLDVAETHVGTLLAEVAEDIRRPEPKAGVDLLWDIAPDLPPIWTDALKLKVIVKNLLSNALKFTESGHVALRAEPSAGGIQITVADTGIGIAPAALPIIFEPFRQIERPLTRRYGGVGLGLYVVQRLLDLLDGTVSVESELGRGSTFRVCLPQRIRVRPPSTPSPLQRKA
ncbi:MAG: ATP-binding protein [Candidatus Binatia bacterium]